MGILSDKTSYIVNKGKLLSYLFVFTIFTKGLIVYPGVFNFGIEPYAYIVIPVFFLFLRLKYRELFNISFLAGVVLVLNVIVISSMNYSYGLFLKQFIPIFIFYVATYSLLKKVDPIRIFQIYVKVSVFVCCLGLLQFVLYLGGLSVYLDDPGRINSVIPEPSHLAIIIIPAFCYLYLKTGLFNLKTLIVLLTIIGTFSTTAFLTLLIFFIIKNFKPHTIKFYAILLFICALSVFIYLSSYEVRYRIDDIIDYSQKDSLQQANATTFSIFSNLKVMLYSLKRNPLFGSGLGNHEKAYVDYFGKEHFRAFRRYGLNMKGGHSLFIRVLSETGLIGLLFVMFFFYKFRITKKNSIYYIISLTSLTYFIARIFKLGGYFDYGIYFFAGSYFFAHYYFNAFERERATVTFK